MKLYQTTKNRRTIVVCSARQNTAVPSALDDGLVGYSSRVGELWHIAICNDTAREFVCFAQIPALVVVVIKECWSVKKDNQNRLGRRSGQMVVKKHNTHGTHQKHTRAFR